MRIKRPTYPSEWTTALPELSVVPFLATSEKKLVLKFWVVGGYGVFQSRSVPKFLLVGMDAVIRGLHDGIDFLILRWKGTRRGKFSGVMLVVLNHGVVRNKGLVRIGRWHTQEERRSSPDIGDLERVVLLDDLAEDVGDKEEAREEEESEASTEDNSDDEPRGLLVQTKSR